MEGGISVETIGQAHSLLDLCRSSKKRSLELFLDNRELNQPFQDTRSLKIKLTTKINDEFAPVKDLPPPSTSTSSKSVAKPNGNTSKPSNPSKLTQREDNVDIIVSKSSFPTRPGVTVTDGTEEDDSYQQVIQSIPKQNQGTVSHGIVAYQNAAGIAERIRPNGGASNALALKNPYEAMTPDWHAPWKLSRVIAGHLGWVRCVAVDPSNEWFCTGAADRTIKIWDLASGQLKLTLTGHINAVRGLAVSPRHPYLFSCAEDKQVKCWDLEQNKVIRHYHGHLSGVYCLSLHPTLDVLITGGRDSVARVWDMRTKTCVHVLSGHKHTVGSILTQTSDPQVITGSHDSTVKLWDLAKGECMTTLTHHKKSVRALATHPTEFTFASGSPDNIKKWKFPDGNFMTNFSGHSSIVGALALNRENVLVSGADNGSMYFWDYKTGYAYQKLQTVAQPGSLESEAGIFALAFDMTGTRLISCEADKSIKIYKEDDQATPETHPIENWKPQTKRW